MISPLLGSIRPLGVARKAEIQYLLYDAFTTDRAAGAVNGTLSESPFATGGSVLRTVGGIDSLLLTISGGVVVSNSGSGINDPRLTWTSMTRVPGLVALFSFKYVSGDGSGVRSSVGWASSNAQSPTLFQGFEYFNLFTSYYSSLIGGSRYVDNTVAFPSGFVDMAVVLRSAGAWFFMKKSGTWRLLWVDVVGSTTPMMPASFSRNLVTNLDNTRVPVSVYIPQPLAYDTFTRSNGALGSTETIGPDSQALVSKTWQFTAGVWAIVSNKAVGTPGNGADVISNGGFDSDTVWTKGPGWTIASGLGKATSTNGNLITQAALTIGTWYRATYTISGYDSGACVIRFGGAESAQRGANGTSIETGRATSIAAGFRTAGISTFDLDNVSFVPLNLVDLFSLVSTSTKDVIADVGVTQGETTIATQSGLALNLDSVNSPSNFVLAYISRLAGDGGGTIRVALDKCVSGTYTTLFFIAAVYSPGATLRVIKNGTSYSVYYNNTLVGIVQTISDAGIINNTLYGLFSTDSRNTLDNFTIWPTGTSNNEHAELEQY